ncbi:unnamed protein product [Mucor hiemalis]
MFTTGYYFAFEICKDELEQLPLEPISQKVDELELITRYTTAAINPLLEDLMKHVMFRWTSVANDECKSSEMSLLLARPDSTISMVIGTEIGQTVGYGEVRPASQALNHKLVGKDLVRLALLAKNAIDTYRSKFDLSFLVAGTSRNILFDWYKEWLLSNGRNCPYSIAIVFERTSTFHRTSRPIDNRFLSLLEVVCRPENGSTIITYASPFRQ